ncbi:phosphoglycolate phosphatase [Uliginosibacterium sp. sgz301328]|uniref:phosphoglycolate phosphatase n=1 Tax=Uliginosibacterium sp. sgz301328 TaxID=3243764 RepID=UPI00359EF3BB
MTTRAVLFDLDGTLVDSIPDLAEAVRLMLAELGEPSRSEQETRGFVGKGIPHLVRSALAAGRAPRNDDEVRRAISVFSRHYAVTNGRKTTIYPGVLSGLSALHKLGVRMGCITNKDAAFTQALLRQLGLAQYFGAVVSGDTLPQKKPEPHQLWHACEQLGVERGEALMVGDSVNDALAARNAGIRVFLVTYGYSEGVPVDTIDCDGLLSSVVELPARLGLAG